MTSLEMLYAVVMFLIGTLVANLRSRLDKLETTDSKSKDTISQVERSFNDKFDNLRNTFDRSVTDLALKVASDYVTKPEMNQMRQEILDSINDSRRETLEFLRRIDDKLDKKEDKIV